MGEFGEMVTEKDFLASNLEHFRRGINANPGEFQLFHCRPDGTVRFSLFFGPYQKTRDEPHFLGVEIDNVNLDCPREVFVQVQTGDIEAQHIPRSDAEAHMLPILQKVCEVLNYHRDMRNINALLKRGAS